MVYISGECSHVDSHQLSVTQWVKCTIQTFLFISISSLIPSVVGYAVCLCIVLSESKRAFWS